MNIEVLTVRVLDHVVTANVRAVSHRKTAGAPEVCIKMLVTLPRVNNEDSQTIRNRVYDHALLFLDPE